MVASTAKVLALKSFGLNDPENPGAIDICGLQRLWRAVIAEVFSAALLVYFAIGSNITAKATFFLDTPARPVLIAIAQAFVLTGIIFSFNKISGGHANPSVTLGFVVSGRLPWGTGLLYFLAQAGGALLGAVLMMISVPTSQWGTFGATFPHTGEPVWKAFLMEIVLTGVKVHTSLSSHDAELERSGMPAISPLPVGFSLGACILVGEPFSGASLNPTRTLASAVVSGIWTDFWIYWTAPWIGAIIAALIVRWIWWTRPFMERENSSEAQSNVV